jgi:hypothetical protein
LIRFIFMFFFTKALHSTSSDWDMGYIFMFIVSGAPSLSLITKLSGRAGGKREAPSSEKIPQCRQYSEGSSKSCLPLFALIAHCCAVCVGRLIEAMTSSPSSHSGCCWAASMIRIVPCLFAVWKSPVSIVTFDPSTHPSFQLILGLKSLSHGYPRIARLDPRLVM